MLDLFVGILSILSFATTYQRIMNCSLDGAIPINQEKSTVNVLVGPECIAYFANHSKFPWSRGMTIHVIGLLWCLTYIYHYMVSKVFMGEALLNIVNLMTATLSFIGFCQAIYYQVTSPGKIKYDGNDILLQASNYWNLILTGTVLVQLVLREIQS